MSFRTTSWMGLICAVGAASSGLAQPQTYDTGSDSASQDDKGEALEEIVVTAERRKSNVQSTASSISVRSGADMTNQGRYSLAQILEDVPGVTGGAASTANGTVGGSGTDSAAAGLTIRGIQSNAGSGGSITSVAPAAAVYVDGVYEGVGGGYDIDRVEVLRGPQGTLYGRSATSGLVAIHTTNPNLEDIAGNAGVEFGSYSLQHFTGAVNVPIINDVLGIRVSGNRYERDGYFTSEGGAFATTDGKVKVLYKPTENVSVLLGAALQDNSTNTGGTTISLSAPNTYLLTDTPLGQGDNQFHQYWAQVDWDLGPATLTYQPAYRTWESHSQAFVRAGALSINQSISVPKDDFMTHELRLASNSSSALTWQVGSLYYHNSLANENRVTFSPSGVLAFASSTRDKTTRAAGVFAEATYTFAPSWRFTGGLRYDDTKVEVDQAYTSITLVTQTLNGDAGKRKFNNTTYKARLEHDLSEKNLVYASLSTGFSPGDVTVTTGITGNPVLLELDAETLRAYEIGTKNRFLQDRLQLNSALYYYDYSGFQTAGVDLTPENPASPTFATLSSPAQSYGAELETLFQLTARDRVGLNLAYTNAYYIGAQNTLVPTGTGTFVRFSDFFSRDKIPGVIPWTASLSYDHIFSLSGGSTLTVQGDVRAMSAYDSGELTAAQLAAGGLPYSRVEGETVGDLNATWASSNEKYSVTGYVRNIGDNRYKTDVGVDGIVQPFTVTVTPYDPRTYGFVLNARF